MVVDDVLQIQEQLRTAYSIMKYEHARGFLEQLVISETFQV